MNELKVRVATEQDVPVLAAVYMEAFKSVDLSERWTVETAVRLMRFFLRAQPDLSLVADLRGDLIGGICGLIKPWWDGPRLVQTEIFVSPHHRRVGVGAALLKQLLIVARASHNATYIEAVTFNDLAFPSSWYQKLGFEDKKDWKVIVADVGQLEGELDRGRLTL